MGLRNSLFLTLQLSACLTITLSQNSNNCKTTGWFGSNCQYKCRCKNTSCDRNGVCPDGVCESGWFGPECQYQDLVFSYANTDAPNWLYDGNNNTCNTDLQLQEINVNLTLAFPFTWLRLHVNDSSLLHEFQVKFSNSSNPATTECKNKRSATVNERTLDVHCDLDVTAQFVILKGEGVKSLCSLYISGGRNVALHQQTSQSSTFTKDGADLGLDNHAVDGNSSGNINDKSCTHTNQGDKNPTWNVTFSREQLINRYVLYNRIDFSNRLKGFTLTSFTNQSLVVYNYTDMDTEVRNVYTLINLPGNALVLLVTIKGSTTGDNILTLCEVELYGDSVCSSLKYGRECEYKCNCEVKNESCFVSTGGCPSGCSAGSQGESCNQTCDQGKYGTNCSSTCSQFCNKTNKTGSSCHNIDGTCQQGCKTGYQPPTCNNTCLPGTYGENCNFTCSTFCNRVSSTSICNNTDGTCLNGCQNGFQGRACDQICDSGKYGEGCNSYCSQFCNKTNNSTSPCHHISGTCILGCQSGYKEPDCQKRENSDNQMNVPAIAVPVVVGILIVGAIIGIFIWWRKRPKTNKNVNATRNYNNSDDLENITSKEVNPADKTNNSAAYSNGSTLFKQPSTSKQTDKNISTPKQPQDNTYYNAIISQQNSTVIDTANLMSFIASHDITFFQQQFNEILENINATSAVGMSDTNKNKNRFKNICAYDHSRVQLKINKNKNQGDYINASYVEGYMRQETFIASQGPTRAVLEDFVRMLSEQGVEVVVMLTNLTEDGKTKSEKYWPEDGEMEAGDIKVRLTTTQVFADYTIRRLQLLQEGQPVQNLTQFHFTSWPDKDVPTNAWSLVDFEQRIASISTDKPIVVHCSAGVGRTGTFIALHNALRQAADTGNIDFVTTVQKLRQDRINMVQTVSQYIFLHNAVQVAIVCMGTTIKSSNIAERLQTVEKTSTQDQSFLQIEYQAICSLCDESNNANKDNTHDEYNNSYENSQTLGNKLKNRFQNILAKEDYRVILTGNSDEGFENYINAVFLPSFSRKSQNILTQLPLPTTVTEFWRMVTQYNVTLVAAFQEDLVQADSSIGNYFPSLTNKGLIVSYFKVRSEQTSTGRLFNKQKLVITTDSANKLTTSGSIISSKEHHLTHLTFTGDLTDLKPEDFLALMTEVRSCSPAGDGRTVYMCRNGAEYSGLACVLSLLLDRLDNDHHLTVPLVVGAIKAVRPQVIPTVHQYKLLYQVLKLYNDSNNVYNNTEP